MRVALVLSAFPQASETFIVSKFLGLLTRGWDIHVVCERSEPEHLALFPELSCPGVRSRIHVAYPTRPRWRTAAFVPLAVAKTALRGPGRLRRYLSAEVNGNARDTLRRLYLDSRLIQLGPDLIHFEFGAPAAKRMYLREVLGCPVVVSFRGYDINYVGLEDPRFYDEVWRHADTLHLLGADLWKRALARGCPARVPHVFIPPAIDAGFFDPSGAKRDHGVARPEGPLRILSVGRLVWKKGYEHALLAIRKLSEMGIHCRYRVIGEGPYLDALCFARYQLGLEQTVEFLGGATREEVRREMMDSDVFLHAAVSEGFCNAVLEAQAMELPVVCSDADGLPENVVDGTTGYVVPRRDPQALADRLARLAVDAALRRRFGQAGRERVATRFRLSDQIEAFDRLYADILGASSRTRTVGAPIVSAADPTTAPLS